MNAATRPYRSRSNAATSEVEQFPIRSQITFGGVTVQEAPLAKVVIFRDDSKAVVRSLPPNLLIPSMKQPDVRDMHGARKKIGDRLNQSGRQILVKQELGGHSSQNKSGGRIYQEPAFPIGSKRVHGAEIFALEVRKIGQNLIFAHPAGEVREDVIHRNAQAADARLAAALSGFDGDPFAIVHR
jgi:hypothetical protein